MLISIDLGGSGIRIKITAPSKEIILEANYNFYAKNGNTEYDYALLQLKDSLESIKCQRAYICIAYPGPCIHNKVPKVLPTLFGFDIFKAYKFCTAFEEIFFNTFDDLVILRLNDVEAAGYSVDRYRDFHILMLGTGIGWKTFINNAPLVCNSPFAGEICNVKTKYLITNMQLAKDLDQNYYNRTLNVTYQHMIEEKDFNAVGEILGTFIGINMLTSGVMHACLGGGIVSDERIYGNISSSINAKVNSMIPFDFEKSVACISKIEERYPALNGGINLLTKRYLPAPMQKSNL